LKPSLRSFNLILTLAIACQLAFVCANTLMTHYARWISFLGGTVRDIGLITGAGALIGLLFRPWMGQWINRLGAKNTWAAGYVCFAVGIIGNVALNDLHWFIYILRACLMMGGALVFTSSLTYIVQIAPVHRRTESIGLLGIGGFLGMLVGPYCGDLLLQSRERADFLALFAWACVALAVGITLLWLLPKPDVKPAKSDHRQLKQFIITVSKHWPGWILLVNAVFGVCMTVPFVFLADFIDTDSIHVARWSEIGLFFLCYAGMGLTLRVGLRKLPNRVGRRKVLLTGMIFMSSGLICFQLVDAAHAWRLIIPALLCGAGHGLSFHTLTSLTLERFPLEVRGTGSALCLMMLDLGHIGGPPIVAFVADAAGFTTAFAMIGGLVAAVGIIYAVSSIHLWRDQWRTHQQFLSSDERPANATVAATSKRRPEQACAVPAAEAQTIESE